MPLTKKNLNIKGRLIPDEVFEVVESIQKYDSFLKEKDKNKIQSLLELRQFYRSFLKTQNLMAHEIVDLLNDAADKLRAFNIIIGTYVTHINKLKNQLEDLHNRDLIRENEFRELEETNLKYEQLIEGLVKTQIIVLAQQASTWLNRYNKVTGSRLDLNDLKIR